MEWQEETIDEEHYYLATFIPENEPTQFGPMILTFNGSDYDSVLMDGYWVFLDGENAIGAIAYDDPNWVIQAYPEPQSHIKIIQNEPEYSVLYQGSVVVAEVGHDNKAVFNSDASFWEGAPVVGTINGVEVSGIVGDNHRVDFDETGYSIVDNQNGTFNFFANNIGEYALDLVYVPEPTEQR